MPKWEHRVGARIRTRIAQTGVSLLDLSVRTGIPRTTLQRKITHRPGDLTAGELEAIATALDTTLEALLSEQVAS